MFIVYVFFGSILFLAGAAFEAISSEDLLARDKLAPVICFVVGLLAFQQRGC